MSDVTIVTNVSPVIAACRGMMTSSGVFLNYSVCVRVSTPGDIIPTFKSNPKYTNPNSITERN